MRTRKKRLRLRTPKKGKLCYKCVHKPYKKCLLGKRFVNGGCSDYHNKKDSHYQLKQAQIAIIRENLAKAQDYICPICKKPMHNSVVLDHHHKKKIKGTGLVRGAICNTCNVFLAKSENSASRYRISQDELPDVLRRIATYLEQEQLGYIHPSEKPKEPILTKSSYNRLKKAYNGKAKFPVYRMRKNKPVQKLTQKLKQLFEKYDIKPEFYKK